MKGTPGFDAIEPADIPAGLAELLPEQGSIELQNDQPGKVFSWHKHSLDEQLIILEGGVTLFWTDANGTYQERYCDPGIQITLPAGTVHGSTAGPAGARYVIKPEGGQTAVTTFLPQDEWPHPIPAHSTR